MIIALSDGTKIHIDGSVIAQDERWQERLREYLSARSTTLNQTEGK